jgi:hypothetical protein
MNLCKDCEFIIFEGFSPNTYSKCGRQLKPRKVCPVTGNFSVEEDYWYCTTLNFKGECPNFKSKNKKKKINYISRFLNGFKTK